MLIPDQFFDRTKGRVSTFFGRGLVAHVGFAHPFCAPLSDVAFQAAQAAGVGAASSVLPPSPVVHKGGTYVCMLSALILRALAGGRLSGVTWRRCVAAIILATLYGVTDEFHQLFVPGRSADPYDVLADFVGASIGSTLGWLASAAHRWGILGSSS